MFRQCNKILVFSLILGLLCSTVRGGSKYFGFTPWPFDVNFTDFNAGVNSFIYDKINTVGSIISHHIDGSVPWDSALSSDDFNTFPSHFKNDINGRISNTNNYLSYDRVFLSVNVLNMNRNGLALDWTDSGESIPLGSPWDTAKFNDTIVKTSYLNFVKVLIDKLNPKYLCVGIEQNLLLHNSGKAIYEQYLELHEYIYSELKLLYPTLPIFVSFTWPELLGGIYSQSDVEEQKEYFEKIMVFSDYFTLSLHPHVSGLLCNTYDISFLTQVFDYSLESFSEKPIAVSEFSYPSKAFQSSGFDFFCSSQKQETFFNDFFNEIKNRNVEFIINFAVRDYTQLWNKLLGDEISKLWQYTGLYDDDGVEKPALVVWMKYFLSDGSWVINFNKTIIFFLIAFLFSFL